MLKQLFSRSAKKTSKITAACVIILVIGLGIYFLTLSHAATPYVTGLADSGSLSNGAVKQTCSGASDGNCVVFNGATSTQFAIHVSGDTFVNQNGQTVQLRGVNRPGAEYRCVQNDPYGFITDDGGSEGTNIAYADKVASSLLAWNKSGAATNAINAVRIPLNEDCWLGINGVPAAYSGTNYQAFVQRLVTDLTNEHIYAILDLHWTAPGDILATTQDVAPDADHSISFWQQVAEQYKNQPSVMFDLFNEPRLGCYSSSVCSAYNGNSTSPQELAWEWNCYENGCNYTYSPEDIQPSGSSINLPDRTGVNAILKVAGTQQLVTTIRQAGANNVIFLEGLQWGNAFDDWVADAPQDPANQIAPEFHTYSYSQNGVGEPGDSTANVTNVLAAGGLSSKYPIYIGEFGEIICSGNGNGFTNDTMNWADSHGYSYTAWGWDAGQGCGGPALVTDNDLGTPTAYGAIVKAHLQSLEQ